MTYNNLYEFTQRNADLGWCTVKLEKDNIEYLGCWHPECYVGLVYSYNNGIDGLDGITLCDNKETTLPVYQSHAFLDRPDFKVEMFEEMGYTIKIDILPAVNG